MVFTVGKAFFPAVATLGAIQLCCPMAVSNDNREFSFKKRPWKFRLIHCDCQTFSDARRSSLVFKATIDSLSHQNLHQLFITLHSLLSWTSLNSK
jgi:hypothetical protein